MMNSKSSSRSSRSSNVPWVVASLAIFLLVGNQCVAAEDQNSCALAVWGYGYPLDQAVLPMPVSLPIRDEVSGGYSRQSFWRGWDDQNHDCRNRRAEVLAATSLIPVVYSNNGCTVIRGLWVGPYSGAIFEHAMDLDIDHIVPLQELYESGAGLFARERREDLANSNQGPNNLVPVWKSLNRSKGAKEPQDWMPPEASYACQYVDRWILVKWYWQLSVDAHECEALARLSLGCQGMDTVT